MSTGVVLAHIITVCVCVYVCDGDRREFTVTIQRPLA